MPAFGIVELKPKKGEWFYSYLDEERYSDQVKQVIASMSDSQKEKIQRPN